MNINRTRAYRTSVVAAPSRPRKKRRTPGSIAASFITLAGTIAAAGAVLTPMAGLAAGDTENRPRQQPIRLALKVQPVFHANVDERKEATSWRYSGAIHTEEEIRDEEAVIRRELAQLAASTDFPLEILPLVTVRTAEQAAAVTKGPYDAMIIYAARRDAAVVEALAAKDKWNLMFVRHRSGPMYYMYIGVHAHVLRKTGDQFVPLGLDLNDVVVDDYAELRWRLRALSGLKNTLGKRVVVIGPLGLERHRAGGAGAGPVDLENGPPRDLVRGGGGADQEARKPMRRW